MVNRLIRIGNAGANTMKKCNKLERVTWVARKLQNF